MLAAFTTQQRVASTRTLDPMGRMVLIVLSLVIAACEPANPPPPGYVAACYGGDFAKYLNGSLPKRLIAVKATESDWPRLAADLKAIGKTMGLEVFDTGSKFKHVRTIEIHLCSKSGIWISADQRIWSGEHADEGNRGVNFNEVVIDVRAYKKDYDWEKASDELESALRQSWEIGVKQGQTV